MNELFAPEMHRLAYADLWHDVELLWWFSMVCLRLAGILLILAMLWWIFVNRKRK